jgi:hypothetical protein
MAESRVEQIIAAVQSSLAGIVGDSGATYWDTYRVIRHHAMTDAILDTSITTPILVVIPDIVENEEFTNREIESMVRFDIAGTKQYKLPLNPFRAEEPLFWTVQNRIAQDVQKKLLGDVTLGGLTDNLEIELVDQTAETTYIDGWATVLMNCMARTVFNASTP